MIHDERVQQRSHPAPRNPIPSNEWKTGCLGSICMDCPFALETSLCHGCVAGHLKRNLERDGGPPGMDTTYCISLCVACYILPCSYPCVLSVLSYNIRKEAANRWNIKEGKESCCDYCFIPCFCPLCSFCQVKTELDIRKEWNGSWCSDASPNYTVEQWQNSHGNFGIRIMGGTAQQHLQTRSIQNAINQSVNNNFIQSAHLATFNSTHGSASNNSSQNAAVMMNNSIHASYPPPQQQQAFYGNQQPNFYVGGSIAPPPPPQGAVNWNTSGPNIAVGIPQ